MPSKLVRALAEGTTGVLSIAATCATAGIIVGVRTLTGLAQRFADIIIGYAQGNLVLTALFLAAMVWVVGLAVPVTASYIMCAVIAAPALIKLGCRIMPPTCSSSTTPCCRRSPRPQRCHPVLPRPSPDHPASLDVYDAGLSDAFRIRLRSHGRWPRPCRKAAVGSTLPLLPWKRWSASACSTSPARAADWQEHGA